MTEAEGQLLRYLQRHCYGERNAMSAPVIAAEFRTNERNVRAMVRSIRLQGKPVAGVPSAGFFWPLTRQEGEHTANNLRSQEEAIEAVRIAYELGLEREYGEPQLFGEKANA